MARDSLGQVTHMTERKSKPAVLDMHIFMNKDFTGMKHMSHNQVRRDEYKGRRCGTFRQCVSVHLYMYLGNHPVTGCDGSSSP